MTRKRTPLAPSANPVSRETPLDDMPASAPETPPEGQPAAALPATDSQAPELDAHGFDPSEYQWLPVRRKPRKDGWTPQRQRDFIAALAGSGSLEFACMEVGMSKSSAHRLRRSPGAEQFSAAWDVALEHAAKVLLDTAFERAFNGSTEPVFDRDGCRTGTRYRQNDRLLMFLLRAYMPGRFRHAHRDWRASDEALPPAPEPMDKVLAQLEPVPPAQPHLLLAPEELEDAVSVADILPPGELPHWHRGKGNAEAGADTNRMQDDKDDRVVRDLSADRRNAENG